jgi:hypothetical protein
MILESWLGFVHVSIRETLKLQGVTNKVIQPKMLLRLAGFMKRE